MITMYNKKTGKAVNVGLDQIEDMEKGGFSRTKPEEKPAPAKPADADKK